MILLLILIAVALLFFVHVPAPGISIAVLAFAAGVVSVRENLWWERLSWAIIFALLLLIERRAIYVDRSENEKQQERSVEKQQEAFKTLLQQGSDNFQATAQSLEKQLATTQVSLTTTKAALKEARTAATGVQESILDITGGDSYAYAYPTPFTDNMRNTPMYSFNVHNVGSHPLMGVHLTLYQVLSADRMRDRRVEDIGFIAPHDGRAL